MKFLWTEMELFLPDIIRHSWQIVDQHLVCPGFVTFNVQ